MGRTHNFPMVTINTLLIHGPPIVRRYGEDAWQEALTRFLEHPPKNLDMPLDGWLSVVARNYARKSKKPVLESFTPGIVDPRRQIDARLILSELNPQLIALGKLQLERSLTSSERKKKFRLVAEALGRSRNTRRRT